MRKNRGLTRKPSPRGAPTTARPTRSTYEAGRRTWRTAMEGGVPPRACPLAGRSRRGHPRQVTNADQVVYRHGEGEHPPHPAQPPVPHLPTQAHRLGPAEDLLDALPTLLTHGIA